MLIILHKHLLANVFNLFIIWLVTFHFSHPYGSTDLTTTQRHTTGSFCVCLRVFCW